MKLFTDRPRALANCVLFSIGQTLASDCAMLRWLDVPVREERALDGSETTDGSTPAAHSSGSEELEKPTAVLN